MLKNKNFKSQSSVLGFGGMCGSTSRCGRVHSYKPSPSFSKHTCPSFSSPLIGHTWMLYNPSPDIVIQTSAGSGVTLKTPTPSKTHPNFIGRVICLGPWYCIHYVVFQTLATHDRTKFEVLWFSCRPSRGPSVDSRRRTVTTQLTSLLYQRTQYLVLLLPFQRLSISICIILNV